MRPDHPSAFGITEIKAHSDCAALFRRFWPTHYRERGNSVCPFHADSDPSFELKADHGRCWGACGKSFDAIDLYQAGTNTSKAEAIRLMKAELGIDQNDQHGDRGRGASPKQGSQQPDFRKRFEYLLKTPFPEEASAYLIEKRGLPKALVDDLVSRKAVAWSEKKQALAFPVVSHDKKRVVGLQYIPIDGSKKTLASGSNMGEGFFYERRGTGSDFMVVTEAIIDGLSVAAACPDADVCSVLSAGSLPGKVGRIPNPHPICFMDNDQAGQDAIRKTLEAGHHHVRLIDYGRFPAGMKDANDLLRAGHADLIQQLVKDSKRPTEAQILAAKAAPGVNGDQNGALNLPPMPKVVTAAELEKMSFPDPVWLVPGLIPEGVTLLAGKPKMGKSYMALNMALAIACGGVALGKVNVSKAGVLYLALEDRHRRLKDRIEQLFTQAGWPDSLHFCTEWPRIDQGGIPLLQMYLEKHPGIKVLVVDVLKKLKSRQKSRNSNAYDDDYEAMEPLMVLAQAHNISIIALTHTRKAVADDPIDEISGSTGLSGSADTICVLKREKGKALLYVRGRDVQEQELALQRDPEGGWTLLRDAQQANMSREQQEVLSVLIGLKAPARLSELSTILGKGKNAIHKLLSKLMSAGRVIQRDYGFYEASFGGESGESGESGERGESGESFKDSPATLKIHRQLSEGVKVVNIDPSMVCGKDSPRSPLSPRSNKSTLNDAPPDPEWPTDEAVDLELEEEMF